jgi:hypothetical protein
MTPVALQVHIGRLVLDGRVASGAAGAIGDAIQEELQALLAAGGAPAGSGASTAAPLASTIAAGIARRLDAMSVLSTQASTSPSPMGARTPTAPLSGGEPGHG